MTREDILHMADEAYELAKKDLLNGDYLTTGFLAIRDIHFYRLAVAAEREACAKIAEFYEPICDRCPSGVATAIRAKGEKA
jgi:hypothetical protein